MRNFYKFLAFVCAFFVFSLNSFAAGNPLTDIDGHSFEPAIKYLYSNGVISGYPDNTFKPDISINRAELLKILVGAAGFTAPDKVLYKDCFPDVKEDWYAPYVCFAKEKGWVDGYPDNTFKPEKNVNKVEAIKMLINSQGFPIVDNVTVKSSHSDVDLSQWYGPYMFVAESMGILNTFDKIYGSGVDISRGEISDNIYRAVLILSQGVGHFNDVKGVEQAIEDPKKDAKPFDAPIVSLSSVDPSKIVIKISTNINTGNDSLKVYVLEYKKGNEAEYTPLNYFLEYYNAKEKVDGGVVFESLPDTMYHFRVKAVNVLDEFSDYSEVKTIVTAKPLEPGIPTVSVVSHTYSKLILDIKLPEYSGDSDLDTIDTFFKNPNNGMTDKGVTSIAANNIVGVFQIPYSLQPVDGPVVTYNFEYFVTNKNGHKSDLVSFSVEGKSANPDKPTVSVKSIGNTKVDFFVNPPEYTGSIALSDYYFDLDFAPDGMVTSGSYSKAFFENDMKNVSGFGGLSSNTTYKMAFWVKNAFGKLSDKTYIEVTTLK